MNKPSRSRRAFLFSLLKQIKAEAQSPMKENRSYKLQGELVELRFLTRAAELGLRVSKPYGDSAPYDFLVESGGAVFKIQVKSTGFRNARCQGYVCVAHQQGARYARCDVDFIAAYIISEDAWYIIPLRAISGREVCLNPRFRRNKYRRYREAWDLLIPRTPPPPLVPQTQIRSLKPWVPRVSPFWAYPGLSVDIPPS